MRGAGPRLERAQVIKDLASRYCQRLRMLAELSALQSAITIIASVASSAAGLRGLVIA
jgi:hypothetical protein